MHGCLFIGIPPPAAELLRECFLMVSWDVVTNCPVTGRCVRPPLRDARPPKTSLANTTPALMVHSTPCTAGQLVNFLETTSKRVRMGVVTAGWRDQAPKASKPAGTETADPSPVAATSELAPKPAASIDGASTNGSEVSSGTRAGAGAQTTVAAAGEADKAGHPHFAETKCSQRQDEDLFYMDEAEAIRQIEKEIEEQIERNHYKALGI